MTMLKNKRKTITKIGGFGNHGFSLAELMVVVFIIITFAALAIPTLTTVVGNLRARGDARDLNGEIVLAKMRAASDYARTRVRAEFSTNSFYIEVNQSGTNTWVPEGGTQSLSNGVSFGYGSLTNPPSNTQASLGQAPLCLQALTSGSTIPNTACIMFNSRGIPVDATWTPTPNGA